MSIILLLWTSHLSPGGVGRVYVERVSELFLVIYLLGEGVGDNHFETGGGDGVDSNTF